MAPFHRLLQLLPLLLWWWWCDLTGAVAAAADGAGVAPVCFPEDGGNCDAQGSDHAMMTETYGYDDDNGNGTVTSCQLYLAPNDEGAWGLYTGVARQTNELLYDQADLMFYLLDPNLNEWSPWHDLAWTTDSRWLGSNRPPMLAPLLLQHQYLGRAFLTGLGALATCTSSAYPAPDEDEFDEQEIAEIGRILRQVPPNVKLHDTNDNKIAGTPWDSAGVHRATHATAGSFTYHSGMYYAAGRDLDAGEQLFADCYSKDDILDTSFQKIFENERALPPLIRKLPMNYLEEFGVCIDNPLAVQVSRIPGAGRGAFARKSIDADEVIAISPVLHLDRSQLEILQQQYIPPAQHKIPLTRSHGIEYSDVVVGQQVLYNYCYGHHDSDVLLLPLAPAVNFINHAPMPDRVNVYIRWPDDPEIFGDIDSLYTAPIMEFYQHEFGSNGSMLALEFVALRDIAPDEELYLDYGADWVRAMDVHRKQWTDLHPDPNYISAHDYLEQQRASSLSLSTSQELPSNLRIACHFAMDDEDGEYHGKREGNTVYEWIDEDVGCLRPCELLDREQSDAGESFYTARIFPSENRYEPSFCGTIPPEGVLVSRIASKAITVVDRPYTTDMQLTQGFRHLISVPDDFYPRHWMTEDIEPSVDFISNPLPPGMMAPVRWQGTAKVVTPWAFRVGVPDSIRTVLLEYCDKMGITKVLRHVTVEGNALEAGTNTYMDLQGYNWYLQRPDPWWNSNLQWLSPGDNPAHEHYLEALSVAGFDEVLEGIGRYLGMDGLVAFHVTFIGVSFSNKGYAHYDVLETDAKAYNIIIPLILANHTAPELDLESWDTMAERKNGIDDEDIKPMGRYQYEYGVGAMMGDKAIHGTSAVDYRRHKEMRLAATIYIADVRPDNVDGIMAEYTQAYPPRDRNLLLRWAGRHWRNDDPTVKLPKPRPGHVLYQEQNSVSASISADSTVE